MTATSPPTARNLTAEQAQLRNEKITLQVEQGQIRTAQTRSDRRGHSSEPRIYSTHQPIATFPARAWLSVHR